MRVIQPIAKLDLVLSSFCLQHRYSHTMARFSRAISHTGDGHLYVMFAMLAWLLYAAQGHTFVTVGLLAFAIELPLYWILKNSFQRRRPQELSPLLPTFITPSDRYSLPSGHTAAAFLMVTVISHFYPELTLLMVLWGGCVGGSRILLGVHFLSDVIIGALLGHVCALLSLLVLESSV